jgi:hypothetical protein
MSTPKSSEKKDVFEEALDAKLGILTECQASNSMSVVFDGKSYGSCMPCPKIMGCETRRSYVAAVYDSMSKGSTGGFEF